MTYLCAADGHGAITATIVFRGRQAEDYDMGICLLRHWLTVGLILAPNASEDHARTHARTPEGNKNADRPLAPAPFSRPVTPTSRNLAVLAAGAVRDADSGSVDPLREPEEVRTSSQPASERGSLIWYPMAARRRRYI